MNNLQNALDAVDLLDDEEMEVFLDIYKKISIENKRKLILENANNTFNDIKNGDAKQGNLNELIAALEDDNVWVYLVFKFCKSL